MATSLQVKLNKPILTIVPPTQPSPIFLVDYPIGSAEFELLKSKFAHPKAAMLLQHLEFLNRAFGMPDNGFYRNVKRCGNMPAKITISGHIGISSRSIVIELRRKKPEESVQRLRNVEIGLLEELQAKLARFQADYSTIIKKTKPELPNWLGDREQDNWEPLFQVATIAGDRWLADSYECAKVLTEKSEDNKSVGSELLEDIQEILEAKGWIKISLAELLKELCADVEKAWLTYNRGDSIKTRQLSKKLADYGIVSRTIRANDSKPAKGFEASQFKDAFERYLSSSQKIDDSSYKPLNSRPSLNPPVTDDVTNSNLPSNSTHNLASARADFFKDLPRVTAVRCKYDNRACVDLPENGLGVIRRLE